MATGSFAARCTVALWHHPRFNSGASHGSDASTGAFWTALYEHGADVVLAGHEHVYERFGPQRPTGAGDSSFGVRQFTVGTGGTGPYSWGTILPNSEKRSTGNPGVLKLTLCDNGYDWNFLSVAGKSFTDSGSGTCHGRPSS